MRHPPYGFDIYLVNVKTIRRMAQIFVAFSEKLKQIFVAFSEKLNFKLQVGSKLKIISTFLKIWKCNGNSGKKKRA